MSRELHLIIYSESSLYRDGNGYPRLVTRWFFLPLGGGSGLNFVFTGLLVGQILYPTGLRVCV
jgi:hypothetical protein